MHNQKHSRHACRSATTVCCIFLLSCISLIYGYPAASLVRIKRGGEEYGGGAPGSGGGAMGPVYICGYAGSSPKDFAHAGTGKSSSGRSRSNQGRSSASAAIAKSLPNPKAAHSETRARTIFPDNTKNANFETESPYYLRPHILHMPVEHATSNSTQE